MNAVLEPRVGGIVLCGGLSQRMGSPKAWLPFDGEVLLQRVTRILLDVVSPVVVVSAPDQSLPALPNEVLVVHDEGERIGPLGGLAAGFGALRGLVDAVYVSACDTPLLRPEFVRGMITLLDGHDAVVPVEGGFRHPLAAVYRQTVESVVRELIQDGRLRPAYVFESVRTREVDVAELRQFDPDLRSLRNANTHEDYLAILEIARRLDQ